MKGCRQVVLIIQIARRALPSVTCFFQHSRKTEHNLSLIYKEVTFLENAVYIKSIF